MSRGGLAALERLRSSSKLIGLAAMKIEGAPAVEVVRERAISFAARRPSGMAPAPVAAPVRRPSIDGGEETIGLMAQAEAQANKLAAERVAAGGAAFHRRGSGAVGGGVPVPPKPAEARTA